MTAALFDSVARIAKHEAGARWIAAIGVVVDVFDSDGPIPDHAVSVESAGDRAVATEGADRRRRPGTGGHPARG